MPSPIVASDFQVSSFSSDVCENLRKMLEVNSALAEWFAWAFNSDGSVSDAFRAEFQDDFLAVGSVVFRPIADSLPSGYLICNGGAVSRTTYAALFAVFGTIFGAGDGSTTFNLPDLDGKFLRGSGPAGTNEVGSTGGAAEVTLTLTQIPAHTHTLPVPANILNSDSLQNGPDGGVKVNGPVQATGSAGGGQPHENLPPYFTGRWLVKT